MKVMRLTPAQKAAITRKWRRASVKQRKSLNIELLNGQYPLNGLNVLNSSCPGDVECGSKAGEERAVQEVLRLELVLGWQRWIDRKS